jgi:hypothetical protein
MEMKIVLRRIGLVWLVAVLLLSACGKGVSDKHVIDQPVIVEPVEGTDLSRLTLTERAVERLDIQTVEVVQEGELLMVPSAALIVDSSGVFWLYASPEPLVYLRQEVALVRDEGDKAFLSDGPPPGTPVVTVGVPELYGAETGIGK